MWMLTLLALGYAWEGPTTMGLGANDIPDDARINGVRDTDTKFTMTPFASKEAWETFAEDLRRRILVGSGLWPLPERTPLNASVVEVARHPDYIVEKVHVEAYPGFLVTGNLYRPVGDGPYPGVANPHGHWKNGRLENSDLGCIAARCITFARMGMVAFSYDMVGYNDSLQFPHNWGAGRAKDGAGREKLWGLHPFAVQLWSSTRVLDFLESLPYVDKNRLACTGASGGGTQTFALSAVDMRLKAAAPVNMISHTMQGGCLCENAPIIRMTASNMEIGALMAPRPLLMVAATGDWTKETPTVEYPAIRGIYALEGAEDHVESVQFKAEHNYNRDSREAVYRFFGKWVLNEPDKFKEFKEPAFTMEDASALRVFPDGKLPDTYPKKDDLIARIIEINRAKFAATLPKNAADVEPFVKRYAPALKDVFGVTIPDAVTADTLDTAKCEGGTILRLVLRRAGANASFAGDAVPANLFRPDGPMTSAVVLVHGEGKGAFAGTSHLGPLVKALLKQGKAALAIDAFLTGDCNPPYAPVERKYGKFPDTFMPTNTAYRVQDIVTAAAYLRANGAKSVGLVGMAQAGVWALFAAALDPGISAVVADTEGFNNNDDAVWVERYYVPCIRSIGDVTTAAFCIAPRRLAIIKTGAVFDPSGIRDAYALVKPDALSVNQDSITPDEALAVLR